MPDNTSFAKASEEEFQRWMDGKSPRELYALAYGDDAVRCSDAINEASKNDWAGHWVAIRLSDGGSDSVAYETKAKAVRFQLHEMQCAYIKVPPDGMEPRAARTFLDMNRKLYDAGFRLSDPDKQVILPS